MRTFFSALPTLAISSPLFLSDDCLMPSPGLQDGLCPMDIFVRDESAKSSGGGGAANRTEWLQTFFWGKPKSVTAMAPEMQTAFEVVLENVGKTDSIVIPEWNVKLGYRRAHGFWIEPQESPGVRILRTVTEGNLSLVLKPGERSFLREGDLLQIQKQIPCLYKDISQPIFRGGHRYPDEKMPAAFVTALRAAVGEGRVARVVGENNQFILEIKHLSTLGISLQPCAPDKPVTVYPKKGESEDALIFDINDPKAVLIREGDVVQIGSAAPFVVAPSEELPVPLTSFKGGKRVILKKTPESIVKMAARAIADANKWVPGALGVPIQVRFNPIYGTLTISYKSGHAKREILMATPMMATTTSYDGSITFDIGTNPILQFGEGDPWEFRFADVKPWYDKFRDELKAYRKEQDRIAAEEILKRQAKERARVDAEENARRAESRRREAERKKAQGSQQGRRRTAGTPPPIRTPPLTFERALTTLGLNPKAIKSEKDVKKAYRIQAVQLHPDKHGNSAEATRRFKGLMLAYQCICVELGFEMSIK